MMENYDEVRSGLHEVVANGVAMAAAGGEKAHFDFGAEIAETTTINDNNDDGIQQEKKNTDTNTTTPTHCVQLVDAIQALVEEVEAAADINAEADAALAALTQSVQPSQDTDDSTSDSDFTDESAGSEESGKGWKPKGGRPSNWVHRKMTSGANPRKLLSKFVPDAKQRLPSGVDDMMLWHILASILSDPPRREKLTHVNTFDDVIQLVQKSRNIIVLTGAGVSVSCGIPDFRSSDGIYSRLAHDFPDLPDPQAMFDIAYFSRDPRPFYKFAREIYPGQFRPSPCHRFIRLLELKQKLLRNYTQNIDTLEQVAGISNVIECHGSFATASCTKCKLKCNADAIRADIFAQRIPVCRRCQPNVHQSVDASEPVCELELKRLVANGIMKPDIVFFGEGLPEEFHTVMASDKDKCDLLIVMGSSLKVRPVALIPSSILPDVPQILINREQLHHLNFDVELLGDSDVIINQLCHRLGGDWREICYDETVLSESKELMPLAETEALAAVAAAAAAVTATAPTTTNITITTEEEEEEGRQQLQQDTDTQSVKSNESDIAMRSSVGAYSDSGFDSSTSSVVVAGRSVGDPAAAGIRSSTLAHLVDDLLLPPELLDEHMDTVDFGNPDFQPFAERLAQDAEAVDKAAARHLSIDSSKDSGIQCEASNSPPTVPPGDLPPLAQFGDSGGTQCIAPVAGSATATITTATESVKMTTPHSATNGQSATESDAEAKRRQAKRVSAAERLVRGTFYCREGSASYVFPGAQVSWSSTDTDETDDDGEEEEATDCNDTNDDDDDEEEFDDAEETDDLDDDTLAAPMSPLLPPSVEAEIVSEISTSVGCVAAVTAAAISAASSNCPFSSSNRRKRRSIEAIKTIAADLTVVETVATSSTMLGHPATATSSVLFSHSRKEQDAEETSTLLVTAPPCDLAQPNTTVPPLKRRRDSSDTPPTNSDDGSFGEAHLDAAVAAAAAAAGNSSINFVECLSDAEALLQQLT